MTTLPSHIVRISLGITFLWIGISIVQNPETWGGYIQPWALNLLPIPLAQAMFGTGIFDILVGLLLITGLVRLITAFLAAGHLVIVMVTSGITDFTVRDIGLLGAAFALFLEAMPPNIINSVPFLKKNL